VIFNEWELLSTNVLLSIGDGTMCWGGTMLWGTIYLVSEWN